ncbi:ATP-binding protein [Desulfobacula sp.]|uniref:sensor histidine kinase n=1 Tax=Desulfobacula sp. TaxID=2593537 RepID=UPI002605D44E|nr:ATP-binding protein [Desulfobacula sp.]
MRYKKNMILLLFALLLIGIVMTAYARFKYQVGKETHQIRASGQSLVKLVGLAYNGTGEDVDKHLFYRELSHLLSSRKFDYVVIQDKNKDTPIISFFLEDIQNNIPRTVALSSLLSPGFLMQDFILSDGTPCIEFSRPIYKNGSPKVVVRLGKVQADDTFFTLENFMIPFQLVVFILMALVFGYYWFFLLLKPLEKINTATDLAATAPQQGNVQAIVGELETFFKTTHDRLSWAEQEAQQLTAKLKVLEYENHQMFDIFNRLDFGILMVDIKDTVFFINDYLLTLLGMDRENILHHPISDIQGHDAFIAFIQQQHLMDQDHGMARLEVVFPEGQPGQFYQATSQSLTDPDGALFARLIKVVNVSREKESEKSRQDFVNHIAHELRTPLTNIKAYNEMMMEGEISDLEMQKEFFNTINDETNRLDRLIKSILKLAETEIGQVTMKQEIVKVQWLLESCLDSVEAVAREKSIALKTLLPDNMPSLSGDKEMLKSALINVMGNAVKYTPESGSVSVTIRETPETIVFEIKDTGFGISQQDLPHIFEKFYRSENNQVAEQVGNGLGLAITAEIIKNHNGMIEVESEPEQGSHFIVTLPKGNVSIG